MAVLDGQTLAKKIRANIKDEIKKFVDMGKRPPGLAVVLVGEDPASQLYVSMKEKACKQVGMYSKKVLLPQDISESELLDNIHDLNEDPNIDGILVQLPLPRGLNEHVINENIKTDKDVDGFSPVNFGKLHLGISGFEPCTPKGIIRLLKEYGIKIEGKNAVVVGRSNIVGKPIAALLLRENATVTICHSKTENLKDYTLRADILVSAVGKAHIIKSDMIKEGAVVVDAGTTKVEGKLYGDCDYENMLAKASWITPVPGGVGPMTIAMLLENTMEAYKKHVFENINSK
ncbi:methylenetetrahydrofolate dehydrogenase (NADP+) / methenyltetrahydrofolate cyclohydrolase [Caldanaerobius fijiensis DSM 17918]|uniref:Bifunctional protein FolD n=1 Tax=Caldanaerobius fijiensis DSM 17918 TaxID=1121256 RepID=A0A1M4U7Q4_9THEO|nr:bifunctional methylenetetrahydrofolate dehydrogenase/methenyltetrahydrofolate cyclohydrolase FolD [Caldanaerobius fijiensis]SHE52683.1 methylenetetrahydrofolate dehydrogenase (NADP+) / methenyltetrahydrofolate cyclohydrolase [Caldanaerobius fijiensis DSM 17918]